MPTASEQPPHTLGGDDQTCRYRRQEEGTWVWHGWQLPVEPKQEPNPSKHSRKEFSHLRPLFTALVNPFVEWDFLSESTVHT